ncbi:metallophosphoesterase family protein [Sphingomonas sp. Leaf38]|uniref:metallophosphoesterase family protein n=1 Tax=Sphingomonas sp. Leaf38 TaxID=1736217 RepID=UPI0009EB3FB0|nr:metallophosphoesterase [Sphingomonas sp. Leaf38]
MLRWLHLSDIHVGMTAQGWLWPTIKHAFFEDMRLLLDKTGSIDVVIFSGDLAQYGLTAEFDRFDQIYAEILAVLQKAGSNPGLIALPGNHDLVRPAPGDMLEPALRHAPEDDKVVDLIFDPSSEYRARLDRLFENFVAWQERAIATGIHLTPKHRGPLAGDAAYEFEVGEETVGVVCLNSTWLQIGAGDYKGRLHVDPRQLLPATGNDATEWCRGHQTNLMVTHQPPNWLSPTSQIQWDAEIAPAGRFDVHLFGHMHEHDATMVSYGGSPARRTLQASSVFGLEHIAGQQVRAHGYSVGQIDGAGSARMLTNWPRIAAKTRSGRWQIAPDTELGLTWNHSFSWPLSDVPAPTKQQLASAISVDEVSKPDAQTIAAIESLRYFIQPAPAHRAVRRIERDDALQALALGGILWVSRDWGLGEDGFLWAVLSDEITADPPLYRLDLEGYEGRDYFLKSLRANLGCSFEQLCEYMSALPNATMLFDNIPYGPSRAAGASPVEAEVEGLADILREYSQDTKIVLRGRPLLPVIRRPVVELVPFEEADVADYVRAFERGNAAHISAVDIERMWQHTGGSPARLDALLADLQVTSLDDLLNTEPEYGELEVADDAPASLVASLRELSASTNRRWDRAYQMLEALTALPRGEQFDRIKRFLGVHAFYPENAKELAARGLIETSQVSRVEGGEARTAAKTLIVPRIVLDIVRNAMTPERRRHIDGLALELYFGKDWLSGEVAKSPAGKRCADPLCEPYEIANACALIERAVVQNRDDGDAVKLEAAVRLATVFADLLRQGNHYIAADHLCERTIAFVGTAGYERQVDQLRYTMARAVRMQGKPEEAIALFGAVNRDHLNADQRRRINLSLALAFDRKNDILQAAYWASEALKGGKADGIGLQARSILAQQLTDESKRNIELAKLEKLARRINLEFTANNIAYTRAANSGNGAEAVEHLNRVIASADTADDFNNASRAIVRLSRLRIEQGGRSSDEDIGLLIRTYTHLFNERGGALFSQAHSVLWQIFQAAGEYKNLLRLFRHSSLIWRLQGAEDSENSYLRDIARFAPSIPASPDIARELAYYRARAAASLERQAANDFALLPQL